MDAAHPSQYEPPFLISMNGAGLKHPGFEGPFHTQYPTRRSSQEPDPRIINW